MSGNRGSGRGRRSVGPAPPPRAALCADWPVLASLPIGGRFPSRPCWGGATCGQPSEAGNRLGEAERCLAPLPAPGFRRYFPPRALASGLGSDSSRLCLLPAFPHAQPRRPPCVRMWRRLSCFPTHFAREPPQVVSRRREHTLPAFSAWTWETEWGGRRRGRTPGASPL